MTINKNTFIILFILILSLSISNPSLKRFKEYTGERVGFYKRAEDEEFDENKYSIERKRTKDFLLFSVFELGESNFKGAYTLKERYLGICLNFIKLDNLKLDNIVTPVDTAAVKVDSAQAAVDTTATQ